MAEVARTIEERSNEQQSIAHEPIEVEAAAAAPRGGCYPEEGLSLDRPDASSDDDSQPFLGDGGAQPVLWYATRNHTRGRPLRIHGSSRLAHDTLACGLVSVWQCEAMGERWPGVGSMCKHCRNRRPELVELAASVQHV